MNELLVKRHFNESSVFWVHYKKTGKEPGYTGGSGQKRRHQIAWTFAKKMVGPGGGGVHRTKDWNNWFRVPNIAKNGRKW